MWVIKRSSRFYSLSPLRYKSCWPGQSSQQPRMLTFHQLTLGGPLPLLILDAEFFQLFYTLRLGHLQCPVLFGQSLKFTDQLSSVQLLLLCLVQLGNELLSEIQDTGQEAWAVLHTYPAIRTPLSALLSVCPLTTNDTLTFPSSFLSLPFSFSIFMFLLAYNATGFLPHGMFIHLSLSLFPSFPHCTLRTSGPPSTMFYDLLHTSLKAFSS